MYKKNENAHELFGGQFHNNVTLQLESTIDGGDLNRQRSKIFYHILCNENTKNIVYDQINKIIFSGLYENITKIFCFLTGKQENISEIMNIVQKSGKKFHIMAVGVGDITYERFTLLKIREHIVPGEKILYIHTKGVNYSDNEHYVGWQPGLPNKKDNVTKWRTFMEYYLMYKHKECIKLLDEYDIVGVNYGENPNHFSGNFWWCTSDYFLTLENQIGDGYYDPEFFICSNPNKSHSLIINRKARYDDNINYVDYVDSKL